MSRDSTAWSVKGIDQATRDIARRAAAASGMTIGEWIDHAIKSDAANRGIPVAAHRDGRPAAEGAPPADGISADTVEAIFSRIEDGEQLFEARLRPIGYALKDVAERVVALERGAERLPPPTPAVEDRLSDEGPGDESPAGQPAVRIPISFRPVAPPSEPEDIEEPDATPDTEAEFGPGTDRGADSGAAPEMDPPDVLVEEDDIWGTDAGPDAGPGGAGSSPVREPIAFRPVGVEADELYEEKTDFGPLHHSDKTPDAPDGPPSDWHPQVDIDVSALARSADGMVQRPSKAPVHAGSMDADSEPQDPGSAVADLAAVQTAVEADDDPTALRDRPDPIAPAYDFPADPIDTTALGLSGDPIEAPTKPRRVASAGRLATAAAILLALLGGAAWTAHRDGTLSLGAIGDRLVEAEQSVHSALAGARDWVTQQIDSAWTSAPSDTGGTQSASSVPEPLPAEPLPAEPSPAASAPATADPAPTDSGPADSGPAESALTEPAPIAAASDTGAAPATPSQEASDQAPALPDPPMAVDPRPVSPPPAPALAEAPARTSPAASAPSGSAPTGQGAARAAAPPLSRAEAGNPAAQFEVAAGMMRAAEPRPREAATWFREAAINGLDVAQFNLGVMYETGLGVPEDQTRALLWYHSAAEQGFALAQYNLGRLYTFGQGIPQSDAEAKRWFQRAADRGVADAFYALATFEPGELERERMMYTAAKAGAEAAQAWLRDRSAGGTPDARLGGPAGLVLDPPTGAPDIAEIQEGLTALGYYEGPIDGIAGPVTRAAIGRFQSDNGLPPTGLPSRSLRQRLN
ncbi:MAG: peptidoglycan-binding protein [Thalassobaculaceae bacterium]